MTPAENLMRLINLPYEQLDGVARTADGHYIGMEKGDIGYNRFFGRPSPVHPGPGLDNTLRVWDSLSDDEKAAAVHLAYFPLDGTPMPLEAAFGVPITAWMEKRS